MEHLSIQKFFVFKITSEGTTQAQFRQVSDLRSLV